MRRPETARGAVRAHDGVAAAPPGADSDEEEASKDMGDSEEEFLRSHPPLPGHKLHTSTDKCWLFLFLLALGGFARVLLYAVHNGDLRRLAHGYDFEGQLCGFDGRGQQLMWCRNATSRKLLLTYPVCADACPDTANSTVCDQLNGVVDGAIAYETKNFGKYCLPVHADLVRKVISKVTGRSVAGKLMAMAAQVRQAQLVLLASAGLATCLGFLYLSLLDRCAKVLVIVSVVGMVVACTGVGCSFVYASQFDGTDGINGTGDAKKDLRTGLLMIAAAPVVFAVGLSIQRGMQSAMGCIQAASECMFQEPSLLFEPIVAVALRGALLWGLLYGLFLLFTCGEFHAGTGGRGVLRRFYHTNDQYYMLAYYCSISLWICEFLTALSQYTLSWVTQRWYFTPYVNGRKRDAPRWGLWEGYANALMYHSGTLAVGSLFQTCFRFPRLLFGMIAWASDGRRNPISMCLGSVCKCCVSCFNTFLTRLGKSAYMDVAITSSNYAPAAIRASDVLTAEVPAVSALHGSQYVFTLLGMSTITTAGCLLTLLATRTFQVFHDSSSWLFVNNPKAVAGCAGFISFLIAASFMTVLDTVADAVLYCFAIEQRRHSKRARQADAQAGDSEERHACVGGWWPGAMLWGDDTAHGHREQEVAPRYAPPTLRKLMLLHN